MVLQHYDLVYQGERPTAANPQAGIHHSITYNHSKGCYIFKYSYVHIDKLSNIQIFKKWSPWQGRGWPTAPLPRTKCCRSTGRHAADRASPAGLGTAFCNLHYSLVLSRVSTTESCTTLGCKSIVSTTNTSCGCPDTRLSYWRQKRCPNSKARDSVKSYTAVISHL